MAEPTAAARAGTAKVTVDPPPPAPGGWRQLYLAEDWWAVWIGGVLLAVCLAAVLLQPPGSGELSSPLKPWLGKLGEWSSNPLEAFRPKGRSVIDAVSIRGDEVQIALDAPRFGLSAFRGMLIRLAERSGLRGLLGVFLLSLVAFGLGARAMGTRLIRFSAGFCALFALAVVAFVLAGQTVIKYYNLEYALWALLVGLIISNTVGTPRFVRPAVRTEFYIKTGLVLLGAEILLGQLLALGLPGIFVAWVVTPIVLVTTYWFGQRILRIGSPSLNMVISADMSVCGVSAAIATAAACKAKREELSLAIGISLTFTVIMMVLMPIVIRAAGMSNVLGGAWMGGTIDATGAVAAAGTTLGPDAMIVAMTVKMIQNILIGVVAFFVAVYWVVYVERGAEGDRVGAMEIWRRFPKFILGFVAASIVFSLLQELLPDGPAVVKAVINDSTTTLRGWFFCLAFVSIGLETDFRQLAVHLKGGKPLILYLVGQSFNLCLTLLMAWIMFEKVFPHAAEVLQK